ncbi:hypothetical protein N24_0417 [Corynebacterium suranareeae]|uniref:Uncharacterized protein n=1 Tax=Corynebacterium suranareeae TaxID=2506452 RepID=A0A160PLW0_9CORY|nr:hypothetical protein N24_0417 [Corynebacterium suranareeae]
MIEFLISRLSGFTFTPRASKLTTPSIAFKRFKSPDPYFESCEEFEPFEWPAGKIG